MNDRKINIELLNFLNERPINLNWFSDLAELPEIVPPNKTHEKLLENYTISPEIYKFYSRVNEFKPFTEIERYDSIPLSIRRQEFKTTLYNLKICNAYYYQPDFIYKLGNIFYNSPTYCEGKEINTLLDLKPYYLEYEKGFKEGYTSFEREKIEVISPLLTDKNDLLKKVFEFITAHPKNIKHYWGKLTFNKSFIGDNEILNAYNDGILQGYYYKAWTIVFSSNDFFTPLFEGLNKTTEQPHQQKEKKPTYTAMQFVVTYYLDCYANKKNPVKTSKKKIETIARLRPKYKLASNTFYKNCNYLNSKKESDLNSETFLIEVVGEDWRNIVLELSENSETLKKYLEANKL